MTRSFILVLIFLTSCSAVRNFSDKIEEEHDALYKQKALFVTAVDAKKVWFTNPANTRYYFLKGSQHTTKWAPGDTFLLDSNLEDLNKLKFAKKSD
jgi:hypothetical protein